MFGAVRWGRAGTKERQKRGEPHPRFCLHGALARWIRGKTSFASSDTNTLSLLPSLSLPTDTCMLTSEHRPTQTLCAPFRNCGNWEDLIKEGGGKNRKSYLKYEHGVRRSIFKSISTIREYTKTSSAP